MKPIISVNKLGKQYRIGMRTVYKTLREAIMSAVTPFSSRDDSERTIWALKDVSFDVKEGNILGILGRNAAGKSTLLKIISRITDPTEGEVRIRGRAGSLLEVGSGFHPELTGRENIYLNGAILGMKRAEIRRKFDEIVEFAEIGKYLDTPVKRYSSGMYMRLAFAVAAHLEQELLIVDEVLAVGDAQFQKKCLGKMGEVSKEGRTVLFVSHNMAAVENFCQEAMLLQHGKIVYFGGTTEAINQYLSDNAEKVIDLGTRTDRIGTGEARVSSVEIRDEYNNRLHDVRSGQTIDIYLHYEIINDVSLSNIIAGIAVKTLSGAPVFLQHNRLTGHSFGILPKKGSIVCRIGRLPLPASRYRLTYSLLKEDSYIDSISNACSLTVVEGDYYGFGEVPPISHGVCLVDANWRLETGLDRTPIRN